MVLMKNIVFGLIGIIIYFVITISVNADTCSGQYGQYGGCNPSLSIVIDKMVGKPDINIKNASNATYVDNLSSSDPRFKPSQIVYFKIKVKNTSTETLHEITLKDTVPWYLEPIDGPGIYDINTRTITYSIGDISPDEEKIYYLKMQVLAQNQLPEEKGLMCITNRVQVSNVNVYDDDTSQLCIEKQVTGVAKTPSAGPEYGLILMGLNLLGIGAGFIIKRKTS